MPESKSHALKRAKRLKFPKSSVTKGRRGYFIAPRGVSSRAGKRTYAGLRSRGASKAKAARIAHYVNRKAKRK